MLFFTYKFYNYLLWHLKSQLLYNFQWKTTHNFYNEGEKGENLFYLFYSLKGQNFLKKRITYATKREENVFNNKKKESLLDKYDFDVKIFLL